MSMNESNSNNAWDKIDKKGDGEDKTGVPVGLIVGAIIAILAVIFIAQNGRKTNISFLAWDFNSPLWVVLVIVVGVGYLLGWLVPKLIKRSRAKAKAAAAKKQ
jgi:uncharacterized integral membrane protein